MLDVRTAQADQQDLGVVIAVALAVLSVELRVTSDVEARAVDLVDRLTGLVVRGQGCMEPVERLVELVSGSATASAHDPDGERDQGRGGHGDLG